MCKNCKSQNKKHLKNVGPIRHNEPPHAHSADVASSTVARRLRIDVHDIDNDDDNDNAWQRGPLWPNGMGPITIQKLWRVSYWPLFVDTVNSWHNVNDMDTTSDNDCELFVFNTRHNSVSKLSILAGNEMKELLFLLS